MNPVRDWESPVGGEVIDANRWYGLVSTEHGYAVWRVDDSSDHVWSSPPTDEGSDAAWEVYRSLSRHARRRNTWPRILMAVTVAMSIVWVVSQIVYSFGLRWDADAEEQARWIYDWAGIVSNAASVVVFGSVAVLAAWFLADRLGDR